MKIKKTIERALLILSMAGLMAGCGGGGSDADTAAPTLQTPPTTAATLTQSSSEAQEAVKAALTGSATVVTQRAGLDASFFLIGSPLGAAGTPVSLAGRVMAASRQQALAVQTLACSALLDAGTCSGSVTLDTNAPDSSVWPAGTYVVMTFNALSGTSEGSSLSMNGTVRIDFLSAFNTNATSFANVRMQVATSSVSGSVDGVTFGPETGVALLEFDAAGAGTLTIDGVRITGLDGLTVTDANNFGIVGTVLRSAYWGAASTYVDTSFTQWVMTAGRPQAGSSLSIAAGTASVAIGVTSSSTTTVVYDVLVTTAGGASRYSVTATYPVGGVPTYVSQPAP